MVKVTLDNQELIYHTPLYQNQDSNRIRMQLENGIILSFREIKSTPCPEEIPQENEIEVVADVAEEMESEPAEGPCEGWVPSKARSIEWDCYAFPEREGQWVGKMIPIQPETGKLEIFEEEGEEEESEEIETESCKNTRRLKRIENLILDKKKKACRALTNQFTECPGIRRAPGTQKMFAFSPFDRKSLDSTVLENEVLLPLSKYELQISWPTGLHIQFLETPADMDNQPVRYVKQMYLTERKDYFLIKDESYRCILSDGTVIKFMQDGQIVLNPCGTTVYVKQRTSSTFFYNVDEQIGELFGEFGEDPIDPFEYNILQSDGRQYQIVNNQKELLRTEQMLEHDDYFHDCRTICRSDGTKFIFRDDGSMTVRFPDCTEIRTKAWINKEEFRVPWTEDERQMWFEYDGENEELERPYGPDEEEEEEEEEEGEAFPRIKLEDDGFMVVGTSSSVYHPHFAGVQCGCLGQGIFTLFMPGETTIHCSLDEGRFKATVGHKKDVQLEIAPQKCFFDKYKNGVLFQRATFNLQCFKTVELPHPGLKVFTFSGRDASELRVEADGNIYNRTRRANNSRRESSRNSLNSINCFVLRRDCSGLELFPAERVKKIKKRIRRSDHGKIRSCKKGLLQRTLITKLMGSTSGYWAMAYPAHHKKQAFCWPWPSTYGKDWLFPFVKVKHPNWRTAQFETVDLVKNFQVKFKLSRLGKSLLRAYSLSLHDGVITGCGCAKETGKLPTCKLDRSKDELRYLESSVKNGDVPCKCFIKFAVDNLTGSKDATFYRELLKEGCFSEGMSESVNKWVSEFVIPHVAKMAVKKFYLHLSFEKMKSFMKAFSSIKVPNYFDSPRGVVFLMVEDILNRVDSVTKKIDRWVMIDDILDSPMKDITEDQIWELVLSIDPAEDGLGNLTQREFYLMLQSIRPLKTAFPTLRAALDYRRNLIQKRRVTLKDEAKIEESSGLSVSPASSIGLSRSSSNKRMMTDSSWCPGKDPSIRGCSCVSLASQTAGTIHELKHLGIPLRREDFFPPVNLEMYADEELEAHEAAQDIKVATKSGIVVASGWESGADRNEGNNSRSGDIDDIRKMTAEILEDSINLGAENSWMLDVRKCDTAIMRAAVDINKEDWKKEIDEFMKPPFSRKLVDVQMKNMLDQLGSRIERL
ncbi:Hypothetical protein NTJ_05352 [Nesidiocoris tenuis]|nr:Hypothetical protein NTJ_05352 [Nesidiocoris tenuis]